MNISPRSIGRLVALCLLGIALPALGADPYLVKDIDTTHWSPRSSFPVNFARLGDRLVLQATGEDIGSEPWSVDLNTGVATLLADIHTGSFGSRPVGFRTVGTQTYFTATSQEHGDELWVTDGTAAGTRLVKDINPGLADGLQVVGPSVGGVVLLRATGPTGGPQLWTSDGTEAGTQVLHTGSPSAMIEFGGRAYFGASGGLWSTDGTSAGTTLVKSGFSIAFAVATPNLMFFQAADAVAGGELWVSDGTTNGTRMVKDINPGSAWALDWTIAPIIVFGNIVVFGANDGATGMELWRSDGTAAGTFQLADIHPGAANTFAQTPTRLNGRAVGPNLLLALDDGQHGYELWRTDGTIGGTSLLRDISPGPASSSPFFLSTLGNSVFMSASDDTHGRELWVSDGTAGGTRLLKEFVPGADSGGTGSSAITIAAHVYFQGSDSIAGSELWRTDGTESGTTRFANIWQEQAPSSSPRSLTATGSKVYFKVLFSDASATANGELWSTSGTAATTTVVPGTPEIEFIAGLKGNAYFSRREQAGLWKSDGTAASTLPLSNVRVSSLFATSTHVFATMLSSNELWATDGTSSTLLATEPAGPIQLLDELPGLLLFSTPVSLWISDGTAAGTERIRGIPGRVQAAVTLNGIAWMLIASGGALQLWKSDGSADGTVHVHTIPDGRQVDTSTGPRMAFAGAKLFMALTKHPDQELWVFDPMDGTARQLMGFPWTVFSPGLGNMVDHAGRLIFRANDAQSGSELWISDGTAAGTTMLRDILSGAEGSSPVGLRNVDGVIYFTANDGAIGNEPWTTDGTAAGTRPLIDLNPGTRSSDPRDFVRSGDLLYFAARTQNNGNELWAYPLPPETWISIGDAAASESGSGKLVVTLNRPASTTVTVQWATETDTEAGGADFTTSSGAVVFQIGEMTKEIVIAINADAIPETNERLLVRLTNPANGKILKGLGAIVIHDDDRNSDLALTVVASTNSVGALFKATNHGPSFGRGVRLGSTFITPIGFLDRCECAPKDLASGGSGEFLQSIFLGAGGNPTPGIPTTIVTAVVVSDDVDRDLSNNRVSLTTSNNLSIPGAFLRSGQTVNAQFNLRFVIPFFPRPDAAITLSSSNRSIIDVPASVVLPAEHLFVKFPVKAVAPGVATISATMSNPPFATITSALDVIVAGPGEIPRFSTFTVFRAGVTSYGDPATFTALIPARSPWNDSVPTGDVTFAVAGRTLGSTPLMNGTATITAAGFLPGEHIVIASYGGDSQFRGSSGSATHIVPEPDGLNVTGSSPSSVPAGGDLNYVATIANGTLSPSTNVRILFQTPANTTFASATQTKGPTFQCTLPAVGSSGVVACTITSFASTVFLSESTFSFIVRVSPAANGSTITAGVDVTSETPTAAPPHLRGTTTTTVTAAAASIPALSPLMLALMMAILAAVAIVRIRI